VSKHLYTLYHPLSNINPDMIRDPRDNLCPRKGIRILTYNIFLRPPIVKNNVSDYKDERLEDFVKLIYDYDIICLQEMFGLLNSRLHELIYLASKQGFFYFVTVNSPGMIGKSIADGGLVILSRFPITHKVFVPFRYGVLSDSLAEKGLLYARIKIKSTILHLFTAHVQASYLDSTESQFEISFNTRLSQIEQVNKFIFDILGKVKYEISEKIILCGDFNVDSLQYKYKKPPFSSSKDDLNNEYDYLIAALSKNNFKIRDCFFHHKKYHPATYAERYDDPNEVETVLTCEEDVSSNQSLDYIFEIFINSEDYKNEKKKSLYIDGESLKVEKFIVDSYVNLIQRDVIVKRDHTQLSDHYGVSVLLNYKDEEKKDQKDHDTILEIKTSKC